MPDVVHAIARYGYQSLFLALFLEALGLPIPGALALLAAGAASASGALQPFAAILVAASGMLVADSLLYVLGRLSGWSLLSFLCSVSLSPETCIFRTSKWFYERGRTTLVFAKFIPGVNSMAPPLAGSMRMRASEFLRFDIAGAAAYTLTYGVIGFVFRDVFRLIAGRMQAFSLILAWVIATGCVGFIIFRAWQYFAHGRNPHVRRVSVQEVAARLDELPAEAIIADVRSHGYYDPDEQRVRGSIRIEPNNLKAALDRLPKDRPIYLYCT